MFCVTVGNWYETRAGQVLPESGLSSYCNEAMEPKDRWYFDTYTWECLVYKSRGCYGEMTNYETWEECTRMSPRTEDSCPGISQAAYSRWSFGNSALEGGNCKDIKCMAGFQCVDGRRYARCCHTRTNKLYEEAYSRHCPNGAFAYKGRGYLNRDCKTLSCPDGFQCFHVSYLFAKCCLSGGASRNTQAKRRENRLEPTRTPTLVRLEFDQKKNISEPDIRKISTINEEEVRRNSPSKVKRPRSPPPAPSPNSQSITAARSSSPDLSARIPKKQPVSSTSTPVTMNPSTSTSRNFRTPLPSVRRGTQSPRFSISSDDTTESGDPNRGSVDCPDLHKNCEVWAKKGLCVLHPDWMRPNCQRSCSCCGCTSEAVYNSKFSKRCEDRMSHCKSWADSGHCFKNVRALSFYCRKSCGFC